MEFGADYVYVETNEETEEIYQGKKLNRKLSAENVQMKLKMVLQLAQKNKQKFGSLPHKKKSVWESRASPENFSTNWLE
jgi:hypothetical protein